MFSDQGTGTDPHFNILSGLPTPINVLPELCLRQCTEQDDPSETRRPFVSDMEWARRIAKRHAAIHQIKHTAAYRAFVSSRPSGIPTGSIPMTPDASDRSISKRNWEASVWHWRTAIKSM